MMDPPEHDRFRALVSRVFTPRAVTSLEPMIREVIRGYLDPLNDATEFDAVADFAAPFPVEVISRMLGVPAGERQQIRHWLDVEPSPRAGPDRRRAPRTSRPSSSPGSYWHQLTGEKRKNPGDDMLSRLTQVTVDRGDGEETGLDDIEITGFAVLLGGAGRGDGDEARRQRRGALLPPPRPVAEDPRRPGEDPRARSTRSSATGRRRSTRVGSACRSATLEGGTVPAGFPVLLITGAATRDPRRSSAPTSSTSNGRRASPSGSVTGCTAASAPRWPAWRAASRSKSSPTAGADSRSTKPGLRRVNMSNVAGYSNVPVPRRALTYPLSTEERRRVLRNPDHVTIAVADAATAIEFFALLGFRKEHVATIDGGEPAAVHGHARHEGAAHHARTRGSRASLRDPVARVRSDARRIDPGEHPTNLRRRGYNHLAFRVDDIEAVTAHLVANGVTMLSDEMDYISRRLRFFEGPEGITLELVQWVDTGGDRH